MTNGNGQASRGVFRVSSDRSRSPSRTSAKSKCSRYRNPPWMSFVERLDVPAAKSRFSASATRRPRAAASRARPTPVIPPPMIRMSKSSSANLESASPRVRQENSVVSITSILSLCRRPQPFRASDGEGRNEEPKTTKGAKKEQVRFVLLFVFSVSSWLGRYYTYRRRFRCKEIAYAVFKTLSPDRDVADGRRPGGLCTGARRARGAGPGQTGQAA